ncbi:MAG: thioesterase family protein [Lautropia sp.]
MDEQLPIGTAATHVWPITESLTVRAHGSMDLPVLATPHLIFMLEDTCVMAVAPRLAAGTLTVGTAVHVDHLAAAKAGDELTTRAELVAVRGRRLVFRVEGRCGRTLVSRGLHERAIVDAKAFVESLGAPAR